MVTIDIPHPEKCQPVKLEQPKQIVYFGTNGCVEHYPLGINFTLSEEEYRDFQKIDGIVTEKELAKNKGWFYFLREDHIYLCFGVPYSPDDKRPGSKTIVMVDGAERHDVVDAILETPFLLKQFKEVNEKYKLNIDFLEDKQ